MPFGTVTLNDGNEIPAIGFGTGSALYDKDATAYVAQALESGFAHIDTAAIYKNEASVGTAIRESGLARADLFITTKYDGGAVRAEIERSLAKLGVKHVDLYLIHFPQFVEGRLEAAWREFEQIKIDGLAKSIGVSNFSLDDMKALLKIATIKPAVNQIRFHPYNWAEMKALVAFSAQHGIVTEAYSSLTPITKTPGGAVDAPLREIAERLNATPAQVIFAWVKSKGVVIVTTSSKKERLREYLDVGDMPNLTEAEILAIEKAGAEGPPRAMSVLARKVAACVVPLAGVASLVYWLR